MAPEVQGIIPRAMAHLFSGIAQRRQDAIDRQSTPPEFKVTAHFMELYNEEIIDLFDSSYRVSGRLVSVNFEPIVVIILGKQSFYLKFVGVFCGI